MLNKDKVSMCKLNYHGHGIKFLGCLLISLTNTDWLLLVVSIKLTYTLIFNVWRAEINNVPVRDSKLLRE